MSITRASMADRRETAAAVLPCAARSASYCDQTAAGMTLRLGQTAVWPRSSRPASTIHCAAVRAFWRSAATSGHFIAFSSTAVLNSRSRSAW